MSRAAAGLVLCFLIMLTGVTYAQDSATGDELETYVIQPGDTLFSIARRFDTTVAALAAENNITNTSRINWGQTLRIPRPAGSEATAVPPTSAPDVPETTPEATEESPASSGDTNLPLTHVEIGIEANLLNENMAQTASHVDTLDVTWIKQTVNWRDLEPVDGEIDFSGLDTFVDAMADRQIMLTVTTAPDWSRSIVEENGPPDNFEDYAAFVSALAERYQGRIAAYQIWNEPNLRSRWKSTIHTISAENYVNLLQQARDAITAADPNALIISAGLAPTGFNDAFNAEVGDLEVNAVDDRIFLSGMYAAGLSGLVDGIGAHPMGWANPPTSVCCDPAAGVETHYEAPHFYFLNTLQDYRQIQLDNSDFNTPIWVTKFGWGSSENLGEPDEINVFTGYTDLNEQAEYTVQAFTIGAGLGYVGPMFVYNLNGCQTPDDGNLASCYYSLLGPDNTPRPAFEAISAIEIEAREPADSPQATSTETPSVEVTAEATAEMEPTAEVTAEIEVTAEVGP